MVREVRLEDRMSKAPNFVESGFAKREDMPHTSKDMGYMPLAVRKDSAVALAGTDGDYQPLIADANGNLYVNAGISVTEQIEDAGHTTGAKGIMLLAVRKDSAAALADTDLDYIPLTTDSTGRLRVAALPANSGTDIGDVDVTSIIPGTAATNLGKAVDSATGATDTGVPALVVRRDTLVTITPVVEDYTRFFVDSTGRLYITGFDQVNNRLDVHEAADARDRTYTVEVQAATVLAITSATLVSEINVSGYNTISFFFDYTIGVGAGHETYLDLEVNFLRVSAGATPAGDLHPYSEWTNTIPKTLIQPRFRKTASKKGYIVVNCAGMGLCSLIQYNDGTANWGTIQLGYTLSNNM
jgi:hypothetical protein